MSNLAKIALLSVPLGLSPLLLFCSKSEISQMCPSPESVTGVGMWEFITVEMERGFYKTDKGVKLHKIVTAEIENTWPSSLPRATVAYSLNSLH